MKKIILILLSVFTFNSLFAQKNESMSSQSNLKQALKELNHSLRIANKMHNKAERMLSKLQKKQNKNLFTKAGEREIKKFMSIIEMSTMIADVPTILEKIDSKYYTFAKQKEIGKIREISNKIGDLLDETFMMKKKFLNS